MNVLAIGCHWDDIEVACVGTLAKYKNHKPYVNMLIEGAVYENAEADIHFIESHFIE